MVSPEDSWGTLAETSLNGSWLLWDPDVSDSPRIVQHRIPGLSPNLKSRNGRALILKRMDLGFLGAPKGGRFPDLWQLPLGGSVSFAQGLSAPKPSRKPSHATFSCKRLSGGRIV